MEGNNELLLCQDEMKAALQMYIEHLMPKAEVEVEAVSATNECFIIKLSKTE